MLAFGETHRKHVCEINIGDLDKTVKMTHTHYYIGELNIGNFAYRQS